MKRRIFALVTTLVGVALALAVVELTAICLLSLEDGHYTSAQALFERTQNTFVRDITRGTDCRYVDTLFPHPYVAFVHHANPPCGTANINNVGLFNDDFPTVRRADRFTILLTGGSVASQLGQSAPAPPAPKFLEEELNGHYVSPNGKPFLVLNGGDGGWKEPQQLILFSMYATSVDAVVTLDGYNEQSFFRPAVTDRLERPLGNFIEVNPFVADENFGDAAIGWVIGRAAGVLAQIPLLGQSHAAYMIVRGIESAAKGKDFLYAPPRKRTNLAGLFSMPEEIRKDGDLAFAVQLGLYQKYTRAIEAIARDNDVKAAYFLQPVPVWGKTLTEEEKRHAGSNAYRDTYRKIVAGMLTLRDKGLAIYDLGDMLKEEPGTIYADQIHFIRSMDGDSRGYRLMAARIARLLAEGWDLAPKSRQ